MQRPLDIAVISDVHLGTYGCHAAELLNYLKSIKPKTLILNGDFIDMWNFRKSYFPKAHIDILRYVLKMAKNDTKVYYITGNHDDALRRYTDFSSGNIHLRDKLVLQLDGKRHWFFHGDIFDTFIQMSPFISKMGGKGYDFLILFNRFVNKIRARFGMSRMSFSQKIKTGVKKATKFIGDFERTAIQLAAEKDYDFVVCGHIHIPQMRMEKVGDKEVTYLNSGDWVENLTALEFSWGKWKMYKYDESEFSKVSRRLRVKEERVADKEEKQKVSQAIISEILGEKVEEMLR